MVFLGSGGSFSGAGAAAAVAVLPMRQLEESAKHLAASGAALLPSSLTYKQALVKARTSAAAMLVPKSFCKAS